MHSIVILIGPLSPDGEERLWKHQTEFCEALPQFMLRIHALKAATYAIEAARQASWGPQETHVAKLALQKHFLEAFDFFHGDQWQQCLEQHEQSVRLIISTTTYKLKHEANEPLPVQRLLRHKAAGGHVSDEPDMLDFGVTIGACTSSAFLLTAHDPSQRVRPVQEPNELRSGANSNSPDGDDAPRLQGHAPAERYLPRPLEATAPDTTVHTVFCGSPRLWRRRWRFRGSRTVPACSTLFAWSAMASPFEGLSPLTRLGASHPRASEEDGVALRTVERRKRATYPELLAQQPQRLLVLGSESGGCWSDGALGLVRDLARCRSLSPRCVAQACGSRLATALVGRRRCSAPACARRRSSACSALLQMLARAACPCAAESPAAFAAVSRFRS